MLLQIVRRHIGIDEINKILQYLILSPESHRELKCNRNHLDIGKLRLLGHIMIWKIILTKRYTFPASARIKDDSREMLKNGSVGGVNGL